MHYSLEEVIHLQSDEYQLSCFKVKKQDKLNEDEDFLRKYDFLSSLSAEGYLHY